MRQTLGRHVNFLLRLEAAVRVFGIYRKLFANSDGQLVELWRTELLALNRKEELSLQQQAYHWSCCPLAVKTAADTMVKIATAPNKRVAARKPRPKLSKRQLRHT